MKLHENKKGFRQIVAAVSQETFIPEEQVEKDYFVSVLLQKMVERAPDIVFKGGTSLSKCYKLINRFSEDIDINFKENANPTQGEMRKLKETILAAIQDAQLELTNLDNIRSRRIHNIYEVKYPNLIEHTGTMKEHLLVETFLAYKSFPCEKRMVSSYILDFLIENEETQIIKEYEIEKFEINVQSLERTFVDKVFAILDYVEAERIDKNSRHLYDLHMIWHEIGHTLEPENFYKLFNAVLIERSRDSKRNVSAQNGYKILDKLNEMINKEPYREDYESITVQLMYKEEDVIPYDHVIETLKTIISSNLIPSIIEL